MVLQASDAPMMREQHSAFERSGLVEALNRRLRWVEVRLTHHAAKDGVPFDTPLDEPITRYGPARDWRDVARRDRVYWERLPRCG